MIYQTPDDDSLYVFKHFGNSRKGCLILYISSSILVILIFVFSLCLWKLLCKQLGSCVFNWVFFSSLKMLALQLDSCMCTQLESHETKFFLSLFTASRFCSIPSGSYKPLLSRTEGSREGEWCSKFDHSFFFHLTHEISSSSDCGGTWSLMCASIWTLLSLWFFFVFASCCGDILSLQLRCICQLLGGYSELVHTRVGMIVELCSWG